MSAVQRRLMPCRGGAACLEDISAETLLGRMEIDLGGDSTGDYVTGATVLVTGAAGSVGSDLCARLVRLGARRLVLVDQAEARLVELARALRLDLGFTEAVPVLADVRSRTRASEILENHRPQIVFHAAAYKQVPLLEANPVEAVSSNVLATRWLVEAARRVDVERFVLFSTDKALTPASILGRTKAAAEWIVAAAARDELHARYVSVRLANVVDSAGSMLPLFRDQVSRGGPVTVTHPETTRYLMTTGEAAGLALVAGGLVDTGGIYWLDLRPAVRIVDIARRLVEAVSGGDVEIEFVGLRAGESLHEHLFCEGDDIAATSCDGVFRSPLRAVDPGWLDTWLAALAWHAEQASASAARAALAEMHADPAYEPVPLAAVCVS